MQLPESTTRLPREKPVCLLYIIFCYIHISKALSTNLSFNFNPDSDYNLMFFYKLPEAKLKTKWEKFSEMKSIQKKKKGKMVWDMELKVTTKFANYGCIFKFFRAIVLLLEICSKVGLQGKGC